MKINLNELKKRVEQKLIRMQEHPTEDLCLWNYTRQCQAEKEWDEYRLQVSSWEKDKYLSIL